MRHLLALLRVAAACAIIVVLLRAVGPQDVLERIGTCPPGVALAAFAASLVTQWITAYRLDLLARTQGIPLGAYEALHIGLSVVFYGLFVPGGSATGWTVRLLRLSRGAGGLAAGLQLLAGDRALATASGAATGLLAALWLGKAAPAWITVLLLAVTAGATSICFMLYAPSQAPPLAWILRIPALGRLAARMTARGSSMRRPDATTVLAATGLSFASHAVGVLAWLLLARSVGIELDAASVAWVRSASIVATLLPATIGGIGLRDGAVVYLMGTLGVAAPDALALSLLAFVTLILGVGLVGGAVEAYDLLRRRR